MQRDTWWPEPRKALQAVPRIVTACKPNHLWHVDLTTVPTALGFWVSWLPFALPQVWPFCWWLTAAVDHFSRRVMGFAVYRTLPSSATVRRFLEGAFLSAGEKPGRLISDQGTQFIEKGFRRWCQRHRIQHRFGAVGKYGSLAVIERWIRTAKVECTRRLIVVPYRFPTFEQELALYIYWYNGHRPHTWLGGATRRGLPASATRMPLATVRTSHTVAPAIPVCRAAGSHSRSARWQAGTLGSLSRRAPAPSDRHVEARCVEVLGSKCFLSDRPTRLFVHLNFCCSRQPGALRCSANPCSSRIHPSQLPFPSGETGQNDPHSFAGPVQRPGM